MRSRVTNTDLKLKSKRVIGIQISINFVLDSRKRLLRLNLTDGDRNVVAMEYKPIACLSTKLLPGSKILIKGPVKCLNKVIFLKPENVKLIGGEVDTLLINNAYENVLLKQLKKPLKTDPITSYKEPGVIEDHRSNSRDFKTQSRPANFVKLDEVIDLGSEDPFEEMMDEDMMMCRTVAEAERHEEDMARSQESQSNSVQIASVSSTRKQDILPEFDDFIDTSIFMDDDPFDLDAIREDIDREAKILDSGYEFKFEELPLVTIDQIKAITVENLEGKPFIMKAKFDSVVEKLKFAGGQCSMTISVSDAWSKEKLRVMITKEVLDRLCLFETRELKEMFKNIQRQPQIREEIQKALDQLREQIQSLDGCIKLEYRHVSNMQCFVLDEIMSSNLDNLFRDKARKENLSC